MGGGGGGQPHCHLSPYHTLTPPPPQVYRARLRSTGEEVAVKVQRPGALSTISKDLYVMRRAVGVYEQIIRRFTAQTTDYQSLVSTFAEGACVRVGGVGEGYRREWLKGLGEGARGEGG